MCGSVGSFEGEKEMVIDDSIWMMLVVWIALLALSRRNQILGCGAGIVGVMFGLLLVPALSSWIGIVLVFINIYVLYDAILGSEKK